MKNDTPSPIRDPQLLQLIKLFNYVEDVRVWVKDRDGRFCWVNRTLHLMFSDRNANGQCRGDGDSYQGKTDYDLSPPFLADQYCVDDEYVLAGNQIINRIELVRMPDGAATWHITNKIPVFGRNGTVVGTAGVSRLLDTSDPQSLMGTEFGSVLNYIREEFGTPISNAELARLAHMSVRSFERKFLATFHLTPQAYLRKMRLRVASQRLIYGSEPLSHVASSCGFADQSHFTREFRRHFGRTPQQYRKHYTQISDGGVSVPKLAAQ
jgi:AraC-like DNA-binding protein